jgi:Uma2 family endonuclease
MVNVAVVKPHKKHWTRRDVVADPNSPERYEVIEGELYLPPTPTMGHQDVVLNLATLLKQYVDERDAGKVAIAPLDVIISEDESLQPDILFIAKDRLDIVKDYVEGPPDLVVEVASPSTSSRDRVVKSRVYARFGVPNFWIVDPSDKTLLAFELSEGNYVLVGAATGDEEFTSEVFPDLKIEMKKIWG